MLRYLERGDLEYLTVVCLTNGTKESRSRSTPMEFGATRAREATTVAEALGGQYVALRVEDEYLFDTKEIREQLVRGFRAERPDAVLCPSPNDLNNTDHASAGRIAIQVALLAQVGTICPDMEPLPIVPAVYEWEPSIGSNSIPETSVDTTSVHARKLELLQLHTGQVKATPDMYATDLLDIAGIVDRFRGLQCNTRNAEGLHECGTRRGPRLGWRESQVDHLYPGALTGRRRASYSNVSVQAAMSMP